MTRNTGNSKDVLSHWHGLEPQPGFEDRVRRRIRAAQVQPVSTFWEEWRGWLALQPVYASVAVLLIGATVTLGSLWHLDRKAPQQASYEFSLLRSGTITGTYAQFTEKGAR